MAIPKVTTRRAATACLVWIVLCAAATLAEPEPEDGGEPEPAPGSAEGDLAIFALIVGVLVVSLSVLFELAREFLLEKCPKMFVPVVETLYGELTNMGFIGIVVFVLSTNKITGGEGHDSVMEQISKHFLGDKTELPEEVETVHFVIFFFMVLLMVFACTCLLYVRMITHRWSLFEKEAKMSEEYSSFVSSDDERSAYLRIRHRFIQTSDQLKADFDFFMYKRIVLGHSFTDLVEIRPMDWVCVAGVFVVVWTAMRATGKYAIWVFVAFTWLMLFSFFVTYLKLNRIVHALTPPPHQLKSRLASKDETLMDQPTKMWRKAVKFVHTGGADVSSPTQLTTPLREQDTLSVVEGGGAAAIGGTIQDDERHEHAEELWDSALGRSEHNFRMEAEPPYLTMPEPLPRGRIGKFFLGPIKGDRHRALFWGGVKGPNIMRRVFRVRLLVLCAFLAFIASYYGQVMWDTHAGLPFLSLFPLLLLAILSPQEVTKLALATSVERAKRDDVIRQVSQQQKAAKAIRVLKSLASLKNFMTTAQACDTPSGSRVHRHVLKKSYSVEQQEYLEMLREMFNSFDSDKGGTVSLEEFIEMMQSLTDNASKEELQDLFTEMDADKSGSVDFEEMASVLMAHKEHAAAQKTKPKELAEQLWQMFDRDGSGSIDVDELLELLKRTSASWNLQQVVQLFNEIDSSGDGKIDKHEFEEFVAEHAGS